MYPSTMKIPGTNEEEEKKKIKKIQQYKRRVDGNGINSLLYFHLFS